MSHTDRTAIDEVCARFTPFLSPNDRGFVGRMFGKGLDPYERRIRQYGFSGLGSVLDAGCGYGQWSIALARENASVTAIDVASGRLAFVDALARALGQPNVRAQYAAVWDTGLPVESFDAIFCYGVLFLTPWRETLAEFARLLRPGGRLYVNANGVGWYRHLWKTAHNAAADYDPRRTASRVLANTLKYERGERLEAHEGVLIEPAQLMEALAGLAFHDLQHGPEGTVTMVPQADAPAPFFQGEYEGEVGVYEVLATRGSASRR